MAQLRCCDLFFVYVWIFFFYGKGMNAVEIDASATVEDSTSYYGIGEEVRTELLINTTGLTNPTNDGVLTVNLTAENMKFDTSQDPVMFTLNGAMSVNQDSAAMYTSDTVSDTEITLTFADSSYFTGDFIFEGHINTTVNDDVKPGVILRVTVKTEFNPNGISAESAANTVFSKLPYFVMNITEQSSDGTVYVNVGQKVHLNLIVEFPKGTADPTIEVTLPYNFTTNKTSEQWSISKVEFASVSDTVSCTYSTEFCYYAPQTQYIANDDEFGILKDWSVTQIDGFIDVTDADATNNVIALEVEVRLDDTDAVVNGSEHWLGLGMQFGEEAHIWVGEVPVYTIINETPEPKMSFKVSYETHSFYKGDEVVVMISIWHNDESTGKAIDVKFTLLTSQHINYVSDSDLLANYTELLTAPVVDSGVTTDKIVRLNLGTVQVAAKPTFKLRLHIDPNLDSAKGAHRFVGVSDLLWYSSINFVDLQSYTDVFQFEYTDRPDIVGDLCRDGYTPYKETCYKVFNDTVNWDTAKTTCEADDATLVMIEDEFEQQFLRIFVPAVSPYKYWFGLKDASALDAFVWTDGSSPSYEKWLPNRSSTSSVNDCAAMAFVEVYNARDVNTELGDWDIVDCTLTLPTICEYKMFEEETVNPAKQPVLKFSKWAETQTCTCHYGGSNQCDCCKADAHLCQGDSHHVCVNTSADCPAADYYDRGFVITQNLDKSGDVIFACGPTYGRLSSKVVPACYVQNNSPDGKWKSLPMYVHNVIGSDESKRYVYGIHMNMRSYMRSKNEGATWEFISKDAWDAITKNVPEFKTVQTNYGDWQYTDSGLLHNSNVKMQKDCC